MCTALQMLLQELPQKSFEMFEMTKLLGLYSLTIWMKSSDSTLEVLKKIEKIFSSNLSKNLFKVYLCRANLHQSR